MAKRILVLDNQKIWPPDSGAPIRIFNMFKSLPQEYKITFLGTTAYDNFLHEEKQLTSNFKEKIIKIDKPILLFNSSLTRMAGGVHTFDTVISIYEYFNKEFRKVLNEEAEKSSMIIATHPWFFPHIKKFKDKILVYDSHNCEYLLKREELKKTFLGRLLLLFIKRIEKTACKKSDVIIACSDENKDSFKKLYNIKDDKVYVLPNSIDTEEIKPATKKEKEKAKQSLGLKNKKTALFIGTYYGPNNEALDFIIKNLSKLKDYTFLIIGNINLHFQKEYTNKRIENVKFYGKVDGKKLRLLYKASDLAINPMFSGSGINIKMLDYMAAGIPTITTPTGARGIKEVKNERHMIICEAQDFEEKIKKLMPDEETKRRFKDESRKVVEKYYDYKVVNKKLNKIFSRFLKNNAKVI